MDKDGIEMFDHIVRILSKINKIVSEKLNKDRNSWYMCTISK